MHWLTELGWAIELCVMYDRWLTVREIDPAPGDMYYFKWTWVCMCMRLGDSAAHRIASSQNKARIIE
jgi:hypothetical protein